MIKQLNQIDAFMINGEKSNYIVTVERIKNDINGNARYKAAIVCLSSGIDNFYNAVYTFTGHLKSLKDEAEYIVNYFENRK